MERRVWSVTRMWDILNTKSCESGDRLNESDRRKFTDPNDPRLEFPVTNGHHV